MIRFCFLLFLLPAYSFAQASYPKGYFRNPLDIPMMLAGNFGECRPGHFHSGLDIKTAGKENLRVYAAAEGYISRIKTEPGGFGHAIYITHPNGYTTLYAHLNDFFPALQVYLRQQQYAGRKWTQDLSFGTDQFPVRKGQFIAYSGNTGGSSAPHLHFEIRDNRTEHPLNPMLFGFAVTDNIAPKVSDIMLYDATKSIYEQTPLAIKMKLKAGKYVPETDNVFFHSRKMNLGVAVHDFMNGSDNALSFYEAQWFLNDSLQGTLRLDDIGYEETRYLNACADYRTHYRTGKWYNSLFVLPNNTLNKLFTVHQPYLSLNDSNTIHIVLQDASGNSTTVQLNLFYREADSAQQPCTTPWKAGRQNDFKEPGMQLSLDKKALYDDICFAYERTFLSTALSSVYQVYDPSVPLHTAFDLYIKPDKAIPMNRVNKVVLCGEDGKNKFGKAAQRSGDSYMASFRTFGKFWLQADTAAPMIRLISKTKKEIRFEVTDDLSSVKAFSGSILAGKQWLCFEQHGNEWFYTFDRHLPKGSTKLSIIAEDESGNKREQIIAIVR